MASSLLACAKASCSKHPRGRQKPPPTRTSAQHNSFKCFSRSFVELLFVSRNRSGFYQLCDFSLHCWLHVVVDACLTLGKRQLETLT
eukprot:5581742-Amphidinium_carterae.1